MRRRLLEHAVPIVGVAAIFRAAGRVVERGHDFGESHLVRLTHAHVDDFRAGMGRERGALGPFDFLKLVDGRGLPVLAATDAVRK